MSLHLGSIHRKRSTRTRFHAPHGPRILGRPHRRIQEPRGGDARSQVSPHDIFESRHDSAGRVRATEGGKNLSHASAEGSSDHESVGQDFLTRSILPPQGHKLSGRGRGKSVVNTHYPPTSSPHQEAVAVNRSRNICHDLAVGNSCLTKGFIQVDGHIPPGHYPAADRPQAEGDPCLGPEAGGGGASRILEPPVDAGVARFGHQENLLLETIMERLP